MKTNRLVAMNAVAARVAGAAALRNQCVPLTSLPFPRAGQAPRWETSVHVLLAAACLISVVTVLGSVFRFYPTADSFYARLRQPPTQSTNEVLVVNETTRTNSEAALLAPSPQAPVAVPWTETASERTESVRLPPG